MMACASRRARGASILTYAPERHERRLRSVAFERWIERAAVWEWMGPRRLKAAGAMLIVASLLLFTGLMLLTRIEMQSDDIIRYSVGSGAYILIGLPWAAAVALWVAAAEPWKAR